MCKFEHSCIDGLSLAKMWLLLAAKFATEYDTALPLGNWMKCMENGLQGKDDLSLPYSFHYDAPEWHNGEDGENDGYIEASCSAKTVTGDGVSCTVRFSDFTVEVLMPSSADHYVSDTLETKTTGKEESSVLKNPTAGSPTLTDERSDTSTDGFTTSVTRTEADMHKASVKFGAKFETSVLGVKSEFSTEVGYEYQKSFTDSVTSGETHQETHSAKHTITTKCDPYTVALLKIGNSKISSQTRYNCPIGLSYTATVSFTTGKLIDRGRTYTFGDDSNAISDLNKRAFVDGKQRFDPEDINWESLFENTDIKDVIEKITTHVPMSVGGATTGYKAKVIQYELGDLAPLYPLSYIQLANGVETNINLEIGKYFNATRVLTQKLGGYNFRDGVYFDFHPYGEWIAIDENGDKIPDDLSPVSLTKDSLSREQTCKAVRPGTCRLRFVIDEKSYPKTNISIDSYVTNAELSKTAIVNVTVTEADVTYRIGGNYTGKVNAAPEQIEGDGKLEVHVYDKTGKEIEGSYFWDAQELKALTWSLMVTFHLQRAELITFV